MWQLLILSLVLFDGGHSYPRLELKNQDVYEVIEDKSKNSLKFINPESSKPVIREITYYHLVEKPYDEHDKAKLTSADEERLETNGHGYQFIDSSPVIAKTEKSPEDSNVIDYLLIEPDDDNGEVYETLDDTIVPEAQKKQDTVETATEQTGEVTSETDPEVTSEVDEAMLPELTSELLVEAAKEMILSASTPSSTSQEVNANPSQQTQPGMKNDRLRRLLQSEDKFADNYMKMMHMFPNVNIVGPPTNMPSNLIKNNSRRKRSMTRVLRQIPEAPTLPEQDYSLLPLEIRRSFPDNRLSLPSSSFTSPQRDVNDSVEIQKNIDNFLKSLSTERPIRDDGIRGLDVTADGIVNMKTNRVRTYGMNLANDHGYVWNNLWSNPGMNFSIGELETVDESGEESQGEDPSNDKVTDMLAEVNEESVNTEERAPENLDKPETEEDISDIPVSVDTDILVPVQEEASTEIGAVNPEINVEKQDELSSVKTKDLETEKLPETLDDLMNNKRFLKWLSDWTTEYMEMMMKHITEIVKEEISKIRDVIPSNSATLKNKLTSAIEAATAEINGKTEDLKEVASVVSATLEPDEVVDDAHDLPSVDSDRNPVSDFSLSDQNKIETLLRRNKHDKNDSNGKELKVSAKNLFGNAFGSEKVTNLFFFFVKDNDTKLEDIVKPDVYKKNDSDVEVLIDERIKVPADETTETQPIHQEIEKVIDSQIHSVSESLAETQKIELNLEDILDKITEKKPTQTVTLNQEVIENEEIRTDSSETPVIIEHPAEDAEIKPSLEIQQENQEIKESDSEIEKPVPENEKPDAVEFKEPDLITPIKIEQPTEEIKEIHPNLEEDKVSENVTSLEQIPAITQEPQEVLNGNEPNAAEDATTTKTELANFDTTSNTESQGNVEKKSETDDFKPETVKDSSDILSEKQATGDNVSLEPNLGTRPEDIDLNKEILVADEIKGEEIKSNI